MGINNDYRLLQEKVNLMEGERKNLIDDRNCLNQQLEELQKQMNMEMAAHIQLQQ